MRVVARVGFAILMGWVSVSHAAVRTGLDGVKEHRDLFQGKRIGVVANQTAYDVRGRHIVEVFKNIDGAKVVALFSPEHGLYGTEGAGQTIDDASDPAYGLPVYSLYGPDAQAHQRNVARCGRPRLRYPGRRGAVLHLYLDDVPGNGSRC